MSSAPDRSGGSVTFGERLRALRVAARLTQEALGERSGTTSRSIGNLERGRVRAPRPATAEALADALGLGPAEREAFLALAAREYWAERQDGEDEAPAGPAAPDPGGPVPGGPVPGGPVPGGPVPGGQVPPEPVPGPGPPQQLATAVPVLPVPSVMSVASPTFLAAERLAAETLGLWRREAAERGLTDPRPIDVRWHWHPASLVGPGTAPAAPAPGFAPPSGRNAGPTLPDGGSVVGLFGELFEALPHRRLVVMGPAGAGKTGALVMLLLAALEHRMSLPPDQRWALPVPVWVRAANWRPGEALGKLLRRTLYRDHAYLLHETYGPDAVSELLAQGRLLVLLDGLDELHGADVADAVARLDLETPGVPMVVSCRPGPWLARPARLAHAAIVELESVGSEEARTYLLGGGVGDPSAAPDLLTRPLTLALLRRAATSATNATSATVGGGAGGGVPAAGQEVQLFEGLVARAYPHPGSRARAVRRLRWLARATPPHGAVHWWALPYALPPLVQRLALGLGVGLGTLVVLAPFTPFARAAALAAAAGAAYVVAWGLLIGVVVLPPAQEGARPGRLLRFGSVRRPNVDLAAVRLRGLSVQVRPFGVHLGARPWHPDGHGRVVFFGSGEPAMVTFSLRRTLVGFSGAFMLVGLLALPAIDSTAVRTLMVVLVLARIVAHRGLEPALQAASFDPRAAYRADLLRTLPDVAATGVLIALVAVHVESLPYAALCCALLVATMLGFGPSMEIGPGLVVLALRGVWFLPPVRVLERDRAAGLLRRVGAAYEFRHEELRQALAAGEIRA